MLKTLKRKIALVAVSVLGASGLAVVAAPSANATSYTGGTIAFSGVRVTKSDGTNLDAVPFAKATITIPSTATDFARASGSDYQTFTLTSAPSAAAMVVFSKDASAATTAIDFATNRTDDSTTAAVSLSAAIVGGPTDTLTIDADTGSLPTTPTSAITFYVAASVAGTYAGTFEVMDGTGDQVTGTWTFTTTGVPATITATAASAEVVSAGSTTVAIAVKDSNGNTTQIGSVDSVKQTVTKNGTATESTYTYADLFDGAESYTFTGPGVPGSTNTVKLTPQGTLASLATSTATITENSTVINTNAITAGITTTAPADALDSATTPTNISGVDVRPGTSTITFGITAPAGHLGKIFRIQGDVSAGTITGSIAGAVATRAYVDITTSATTGKGSGTFTLGGAALLNGAHLTLTQVNAALGNVAGVNKRYTQTAPSFLAAGVTSSPAGSLVAKLGASTELTITVADQYEGSLGAGYLIYAYRGATVAAGTFLGQTVTKADGTATYTVTNATTAVAGTAESYSFRVINPIGTITVDKNALNVITYSAEGAITTISINDGAGITGTGIADARSTLTAAAETVLPIINTPITAGAAGVSDITTDRTYTIATAAKGGTNAAAADRANAIELVTTTTPANSVVYTGTAGVKFLTTSPATTAAAWDGGAATVTRASGASVYAFSTKTGLNTVTATSGGLSVTRSFWVEADAAEFYNIAVSPATLSLDPGAYEVVTVTVTDAFGNPVDTTGNAVAVAATGAVLLGGFASSSLVDTGSDGTVKVTVIGNNTGGSGTVTVTNNATTGAWATGYVTPTNATAPKTSGSVAATVKTVTSTTNPAIEAVKTDVKAVSDTVATLSKAVTTIQSSVTELTSSFSAQIKSLSAAIAQISKAIAALSKKIK
jgi:hypothetical protein